MGKRVPSPGQTLESPHPVPGEGVIWVGTHFVSAAFNSASSVKRRTEATRPDAFWARALERGVGMREAQEWFSTSVESTRTAWKASTAKALFWMALYGASSAGWLVTARLAVDAEVTAPIFLVELLTNLLLVAALAAVWCARGRSGPLLPSPALLAVELLKATANVLALLAIRFVSPLVASVVSNAYPCVFLAISACMFSFKADAGTFGRAVGLVATLIAYTVALDVGGAGARALEPVGIACIVASMTFGCFADCLSEGRLAERRSFADVLLPWRRTCGASTASRQARSTRAASGAGSSFGLESSSSLEPLESAPSLGSEAAS
jgi:hypothetical protein